jgi:hypothetical protein
VRYYVICKSELHGIAPHIIAEVVRDAGACDAEGTIASALAGERRVIVTRRELLEHPLGLSALQAWDADDDSAYDDECSALRIGREPPRRPGLRLVPAITAD